MPKKGGVMTYAEQRIAEAMAETRNKGYAAHLAGVSPTSGAVDKALQRPAVQEDILRREAEKLTTEGVPVAVATLISIAGNEKLAPGARVNAATAILKQAYGPENAAAVKEPHEMTLAEVNARIAQIMGAGPIIDAVVETIPATPTNDLFS